MHQVRFTIVLCASEGAGDPVARWMEPALEAWPPDEPRPCVVVTSLALLLDDRARTVAGESDPPPVVVALDDGVAPQVIARLAAQARRSRRPMVVLVPATSSDYASLVAEGVVVAPWSITPEALVASVRALAARQPMVRRLARMFDAQRDGAAGVALHSGASKAPADVAAVVQRAFMTNLHGALMGMEVAATHPPGAGVAPWISSVVQLDTSLVRFYLAETEGCDAETALIMLLVARTLDHQSMGLSPMTVFEPARSLARLNATLAGRTSRGVRAIYGVLDTEAGELTIAGAGAAAPTVFDGTASRRIELGATPLGTGHHRDIPEHVVSMRAGDVLAAPGRALADKADVLAEAIAAVMGQDSLAEALEAVVAGLHGATPPLLLLSQRDPGRAAGRPSRAA